jgi:hypothetical protein
MFAKVLNEFEQQQLAAGWHAFSSTARSSRELAKTPRKWLPARPALAYGCVRSTSVRATSLPRHAERRNVVGVVRPRSEHAGARLFVGPRTESRSATPFVSLPRR